MTTMPTPGEPDASTSASDQARLRRDKVRVAVLVWQLCEQHGIRALAAGGTIFAQLGLVSPRVSPTATVIVEPIHQLHLILALEGVGWSRSFPGYTRGFLPPVFVRLVHPTVVCPVDVYDIFPGFYVPPAEAFEQLWTRRVELPMGGIGVPSLDRVSTMLVAGHDQLGPLARDRRAVTYIDYFVSMFRNSLTPEEQDEVVALVDAVQGHEPLRPFLVAIGRAHREITLPSEIYCQVRLVVDRVSDPIIFAVALFESPPGHRGGPFWSITRRHPARVIRALLAAPRSIAIILGSRARQRRQLEARPAQE
ncbi:hypothetical protein BH09ACT2_BH09ACT2_08520 [soil metagenome]